MAEPELSFCYQFIKVFFRYNNKEFIYPPLGGFGEILPSMMMPSGNIIISGNISPNSLSGGHNYINDKYFITYYFF
jgi:hypothetical protein